MAAGGAPTARRTRGAAGPPPFPSSRAPAPPPRRRRPLPASSASPPFWLLPPVPGSEPGSGYRCSAEGARGRGKCFRGNGPRVGVCKLASVPAGQRRPQAWHGALGPGGGAARRGRPREAAPGRFLKQSVKRQREDFIWKTQDWPTVSSDHRQEPGRVQGFLEPLSPPPPPWRTLSSV